MSTFLYLNLDGGKRMKKKFLKVITTVVTVIIATFLVLVGYLKAKIGIDSIKYKGLITCI